MAVNNNVLDQLIWTPGDLLMLGNTSYTEFPPPFILTSVKRLARGSWGDFDVRLSVGPENEKWTLYPRGQVLCLCEPEDDGKTIRPNAYHVAPQEFGEVFEVQLARVGREEIAQFFRERGYGFGRYANWIENSSLVTDGGILERILTRLDPQFYLQLPRFRKGTFDYLFVD